MFSLFLQVLIPTVVSVSMKAITENQLHDFLINSRHSCKKKLLAQLHIMRDYNNRRSSDKIWAQERRLFRQNNVIFPSFSSVTMNFFSPIGLISFMDPSSVKGSLLSLCWGYYCLNFAAIVLTADDCLS